MNALISLAERSTRLLAMGESVGKGPKPKWLDATTDFTVTGLASGSTVLGIGAPCLRDTAHEVFAQQEFWREQPDLDQTALELAALAVEEVKDDDSAGDRFDNAILDAVLKFKKIAQSPQAFCELIPEGSALGRFRLDEELYQQTARRIGEIPASQAWGVNGKLDEIKHSAGHFQLVLDQGARLLGKLCPTELDAEDLRSLWGRQVTAEGMVHFKVNGKPRLIEARRLSECVEGDRVFGKMPTADKARTGSLTPQGKPTHPADLSKLKGAWPGDEPIEDLLAKLD